MYMNDATTLRQYADYTFNQLINLIQELNDRVNELEAAEDAAYDQGYEDGREDVLDGQAMDAAD